MPCLTPSPTPREPTDLGAQRAIAAIQDRPDTTALLAALPADDPDKRYSWSAFPGRAVQHGPGSTDESTYLVCYCLPDTRGYRWEAHLKTHEIFYVNDNANLSAKYGALYSPSSSASSVETNSANNGDAASRPADAVRRFYAFLNDKHYAAAYALLSDSFRASSPFEAWKAGYASTISSDATVEDSDDPADVPITLTARDQRNGTVVTTVYRGSWATVSDGHGGWLLDDGRLQKSSSN